MKPVLFLVALLLSACAGAPDRSPAGAGAGPAVPRAATLYRDTVTVQMRDGALCTGVRPGGAGPWSTTLSGCAYPWPVEVLRTTSVPRLPLAPAAGDPWVVLSPPGGPPLQFAPRGAVAG